jgi:hypothetical protein
MSAARFGGVATHSEFIHGRPDRAGGSVLPNAVTNGNISKELADILTDLYVASRGTRSSLRTSSVEEARQRVLAILDHHAQSHAYFQPVVSSSSQGQQPQYQRGQEPHHPRHSHSRLDRVLGEELNNNLSRQTLEERVGVLNSFAVPGGVVYSSSRPSRGNIDTLAGRHLEDLFNRTPSPEGNRNSVGRRH